MKQSGDWTRTRSLALFHLLECPYILNVRIITTIRLSRLSQRIETSFTPLASRRFPSTLNMHVNTPLCSTIDNLTALQVPLAQLQIMGLGPRSPHYSYDLSRQRRRSVILVYIPHEITVQYNYLHRQLNCQVYESLFE